MNARHPRVDLAGIVVDLMDEFEAVELIMERAAQPARADRRPGSEGYNAAPLSVVSANLDHIVQFGHEGRWRRTLGDSLRPTLTDVHGTPQQVDWLTLLDGAPLVAQANRLTGREWPRLAGSELIDPLLDAAEQRGISVGFLGGSYVVQRLLSRQLTRNRPGLVIAGLWSPDRSELADEEASLRLAESIAEAGVQLLIVGLGKPRQELWMARYGPATGANVLLAFGAVVDFLADAIQRAPRMASDHGLEWAWRLVREPRRLAKRYLLDDPPGLVQMRRGSELLAADITTGEPTRRQAPPLRNPDDSREPDRHPVAPARSRTGEGSFVSAGRQADVTVLVVTYNSAGDIEALLSSLRHDAERLRLRVVVADNDSTDNTFEIVRRHSDVVMVDCGGNLGYASGINRALRAAGDAQAYLILNPDLQVKPGAVAAMFSDIASGVGDVVVPRLEGPNGVHRWSLRREPSLRTVLGDALFGSRWAQRPAAFSETDAAPESYQFGHEVEWATGAAVMVSRETVQTVGGWDERFFLYSEETDFFRRAREAGAVAWYEPRATMMHTEGGSGSSADLNALMAVNRIRYMRKHHAQPTASLFRAGVFLHELLRVRRPDRRGVLSAVSDEARWDGLLGPTPTQYPARVLPDFPTGSIIIPAHNESAVITRTLAALDMVLRTGRVEVIVVCNGCTDETAALASAVPGVQVIDSPVASKTAAMNAGDAVATHWPRIYLDADTEISPTALRRLLESLTGPVLAARPAFHYDDDGATWPVRAYYRARRRLPSTKHALWGAGVFGVTEVGHARFGPFPDVTADDYFVDQQFTDAEKMIVPTPPVHVRTPRDVPSLLKVLRRNHRGPAEQSRGRSALNVPAELIRSVRGPRSALDALSYTGLAAAPRFYRRRSNDSGFPTWERDESSRTAGATTVPTATETMA